MTTDRTALAARLEAGETGPEIDAAIAVALHLPPPDAPEWLARNFPVFVVRQDGRVATEMADGSPGIHWKPQPLTTSLDACRDATPEGWRIGSITPHYHTDGVRYDLILMGPEGASSGGRARTIEGAWAMAILDAMGAGG